MQASYRALTPICGPAAYIAGLRSELRLKFAPGEPLYMERTGWCEADEEMDIPMLHDHAKVLWNKKDHLRTTYSKFYPEQSNSA